jgi:hypothetical protein
MAINVENDGILAVQYTRFFFGLCKVALFLHILGFGGTSLFARARCHSQGHQGYKYFNDQRGER